MLYTLYCWLVVGIFSTILTMLYFPSMASTVPLAWEYAFVMLHLEMDIKHNSLTSSMILCRYGIAKNVCPIDGLVDIGETTITTCSL